MKLGRIEISTNWSNNYLSQVKSSIEFSGPVSLSNFLTAFPKELLEKAKKNMVRECDETEKGHYVAYVDEGNESFDVSLMIKPNKEMGNHQCDCKKGKTFCQHKISLLLHIAGRGNSKQTKTKVKKTNFELLLDEADPSALKKWLHSVLLKNKDLELGFMHHFSLNEKRYTPEEISKATDEAIKAVIKKQRTIETSQLKRIVDLWEEIHTPVVNKYLENVADNLSFSNLHTLLDTCWKFQLNYNFNSNNKITKYIESILDKTIPIIISVFDEAHWLKTVNYFVDAIDQKTLRLRFHYVKLLINVLNLSHEERKLKLIELLVVKYQEVEQEKFETDNFSKLLFKAADENKLTDKILKFFKPIRYDNEFNVRLIQLLIERSELAKARKFALEQIQHNVYKEFNEPYLVLLKRIYSLENDQTKLAGVISQLVPMNWDMDDYQFVFNQLPSEEEKKKWRNDAFTRARSSGRSGNVRAIEFCFQIVAAEGKFKKMIDYIEDQTPYKIINLYFEQMVTADSKQLMQRLLNKGEPFLWVSNANKEEEDEMAIVELYEKFIRTYPKNEIELALKYFFRNSFYLSNDFVSYLNQKLMASEPSSKRRKV